MSSTPEKLAFASRHPVLRGAISRTFKVGKEQILAPIVMTIATIGISWLFAWPHGSAFSLKIALLTVLCSSLVGLATYFLFNLGREPLIILREHQAILDSTLARLRLLEADPKQALPVVTVTIRDALVESLDGTPQCFLNINVHNETEEETNLTNYVLTLKIIDKTYDTNTLLEVSEFYLSRFSEVYVEDYEEPEEQEIGKEDLEDFLAKIRHRPLLRKGPSVFGWIAFTAHHAQLPIEVKTIGVNEYSVQNEEGEYEIIEDPETRRFPNFNALTEMTLTLTDGYNQPHTATIKAPFRQHGKRIKRRSS